MNYARLPEWCLRLGILYLIVGMCFGAYMGMKEDFAFKDVHAHFNLLGYVSTFLIGLFLKAYPAALTSKLMRVSVMLILIIVQVMLALLVIYYLGYAAAAPALGIASFLVLFSYIFFAINVFRATA